LFISTVIPTIGRPSLDRAVHSLLLQEPERSFEVIVVNDSGRPLPAAGWQAHPAVRILEFNRRNNILGRNHGAAQAAGRYLHFLDDDDWLFPGAYEALHRAAEGSPEAVCVYGAGWVVDDSGLELARLDLGKSGNCFAELVGGSWIQLGQAMIRKDVFDRVGGFDPQFVIGEENQLFRLAAHQGDFAHTPEKIVHIRRGEDWTTSLDYTRAMELERVSRSLSLALPGAFARLMDSAETGYWYGRIFKAYLSDALRSPSGSRLRQRLDRFLHGCLATARAGGKIFGGDFWQAVRDDHVPCSHPRVLEQVPPAVQPARARS
jgi:glycosyltransferase involved in cell wall biosynthesis